MGKELVISSTRHETKVAILEDDQLVEVYFQRPHEYSLAGSIHKGRVTRVLPGMQSAFVDIGLDRDAFLYVSDFFEEHEEYDKIPGNGDRIPPVRHVEPIATFSAPVVVVEEKPVAGPVAPPEQRADDQDGRDRRGGRRSRRRRNRGRGFPESKYAASEPEIKHTPEPVVAIPEEARPEPAEDFAVLPGESLAKYRRGEEGAEDVDTEGLPEGAVPDSDAVAESDLETISGSDEIAAEAALPVKVVEDETPEEEGSGDSVERVLDSGIADAVENAAVIEYPPAEPGQLAEEPLEPEFEEPPEPASETLPATIESPAASETGLPEAQTNEESPAPELDEETEAENFGDQQTAGEMAQLEGEGARSELQEAVSEEHAEAKPLEEGVEPARMPVSLTATLREQGQPRYMHRVSRRMRRKMRGGGPQEQRPEGTTVEQRPAEAPPEPRQEQQPRTFTRPEKPPLPSIAQLLKEGQEILVQIAKEPLGQKGARITSHIALPGRFVVYMPTVEHLGVSRKIASDEERQRLKRILLAHRGGMTGGFIVRTAGEGQTESDIAADMMFLYNLWLDIRQKSEKKPAPALIHHDLDLVQRVLRDQMTEDFKAVWCDNEDLYESVVRFVQRFQPTLVGRVRMYTRSAPIFDAFNITSELEKALRPKVWLKSGGYIVINQTEALVAIDINTGKFVGKSNKLEDTIVKTNTEAIKEIVRQIRLRDLGGIIVIDFIDMDERKSRQKVMQVLEETMRTDRAPYKILQFNDFGLVAITRKRVKQSLERTLCSTCPYCEGAGYVKSVQTIISEIEQEAHKVAKAIEGNEVMLRVHPEVAKVLKSNDNTYLEEIEETLGRSVLVKSDPALHQEKFDLI